MYHLVLLGIVGALSLGGWAIIRTSPRVLSMLLPPGLTFGIGAGLFVTAVFCAFLAAYGLRSAGGMLGCFVQGYVGLWLMLATSSGARGSYSDDQMLRRIFIMVLLLLGVIVSSLYIHSAQLMAGVDLALVIAGLYLVRDFQHFLDRER